MSSLSRRTTSSTATSQRSESEGEGLLSGPTSSFKRMNISSRYDEDGAWAHETVEPPREEQRFRWKTVLAAVVMLLAGVSLFTTGAVIYWGHTPTDKNTGLDILIVGAILLLPGCYAASILYGVYKGWSGYDIDLLPSYD